MSLWMCSMYSVKARVALARDVWEPLRRLRDDYQVGCVDLAECFGVQTHEMAAVLHAARLQHATTLRDASLDELLDA